MSAVATTTQQGSTVLVECPYNSEHHLKIDTPETAIHLARCRLQNLRLVLRFRVCIFNPAHHVRIEEIDEHEKQCFEVFESRENGVWRKQRGVWTSPNYDPFTGRLKFTLQFLNIRA